MKTLIKNVRLPEEYGYEKDGVCVLVENEFITFVGKSLPEEYKNGIDNIIEGKDNLLVSGFYNSHCHAAMTLFRGYGEDLPLQRWLNERIFPAEDKLTNESVYAASRLAIAEMIQCGTVSFSDMYFFEDNVARAVEESGIKANISRSLVSFDDDLSIKDDYRFKESERLIENYHNTANGRIKVDMALHAEYSNREKYIRETAEYTKEKGLRLQLHTSETEQEHNECIERHGRTPVEFFADCGVLDVPTTLAHCVWVSDGDIDILADRNVCVSHNVKSNLKLASGVMPLRKMLERGVCVSLGTDGAASNNSLDILQELKFASIVHKGANRNAEETFASKMLDLVTVNGARAQGRADCGRIKAGYKADLVLIDLNSLNNIPCYNTYSTLCYSASSSDVLMTMADGRVLYKDGEFKTLDIEKIKYDFKNILEHYFD